MALLKNIVDGFKSRAVGRVIMEVMEKSSAGSLVTEDSAMRLATVNACVRVLSEDVAVLPLRVYERMPSGGKRRATEHPLYEILNVAPNPEMTAFTFWQAIMVSILLTGDGYAFKEYDRAGRILGLWPVLPSEVTPQRNSATGKIEYRCDGIPQPIPASEILHVVGMSYDGLKGLSPIGYARETVGTDIAAEKYSGKFFKNGVHLSGVVSSQKPIGDEAYDRTVARFREMFAGLERAHGVAFLEDGATYTPIGINAKDAQFIETRKFNREQIAGIYRVPPHLIGDLSRATFSNIEHQSIDYLQHGLLSWLTRIQQATTIGCLNDQDRKRYLIEHHTAKFLQGDTVSRMSAYQSAIQNGILMPNEGREMENREPLPGLDVAILPKNMTIIDIKTGKIVSDTSAGGADPASGTGDKQPKTGTRTRTGVRAGRKFEKRALIDGFEVDDEQLRSLKIAVRKWLLAQEVGIMAAIEGAETNAGGDYETRAKRVYSAKHITDSLNGYYRSIATKGPEDLMMAVEDGEFPDWRDMTEALDGMARTAWDDVRGEIGESVDEKWMRGFMERYHSDMGARLAIANLSELEGIVKRASETETDPMDALGGIFAKWHSGEKESDLASHEVKMCVNEAKIAAYRAAGYESIWTANPNACPACKKLNGRTVRTLKPPLHLGCGCSVRLGAKAEGAAE